MAIVFRELLEKEELRGAFGRRESREKIGWRDGPLGVTFPVLFLIVTTKDVWVVMGAEWGGWVLEL